MVSQLCPSLPGRLAEGVGEGTGTPARPGSYARARAVTGAEISMGRSLAASRRATFRSRGTAAAARAAASNDKPFACWSLFKVNSAYKLNTVELGM
jgi:hypothetical protein